MRRRGNVMKWWAVGVVCFAVMFAAVFVGVQYFTKSGIFTVPGIVYYDESLNDEERAALGDIFTDEVRLVSDVNISARDVLELPALQPGEFVTSILVPVTDFYGVESEVAATSASDLLGAGSNYTMIDVGELDFSKKLLRVNNRYYLDDFKAGAVFRIISFQSENYNEEILPLVATAFTKNYPSSETVLTITQTGVTALSRRMNSKLNAVGDAGYFAAEIGEYLSQFDLTHTSNESSFTEYATGSNICSDPRFIDTLTAIGLDIVELTGNHNTDCGDEAAADTVDIYAANGIQVVGGGKNAEAAAIPLELDDKENKITMLAYNLSTGGATTDDTPGANQYYEEVAAEQIGSAKARGDFVIVDIQYYECSSYASEYEDPTCDYANSSAGDQVGLFRHLIDLGADVVVGTSAHQPQTYELYGDGVIYYGLGNLFFDQTWWPGTTRSLVLVHHIYRDKLLQTEIVPTVYDDAMQTKLMDKETTKWYLSRLIDARP